MVSEIVNYISTIKGNDDCLDDNTKQINDFIKKYTTNETEEKFIKELKDLIINIM